jgi:hypothetical protein
MYAWRRGSAFRPGSTLANRCGYMVGFGGECDLPLRAASHDPADFPLQTDLKATEPRSCDMAFTKFGLVSLLLSPIAWLKTRNHDPSREGVFPVPSGADPELLTPLALLNQAVTCPVHVENPRDVVLLVHGTGMTYVFRACVRPSCLYPTDLEHTYVVQRSIGAAL